MLHPSPRHLDRLVVRGSDRVRLLPVEQVSWIEADGMYVKLHTRDGAVQLHRELPGTLDGMLDPRRLLASIAPPSSTSTSWWSCGRTRTAPTWLC